MYPAERRAAAVARKRFILDQFSDHLVFVQVFRVNQLTIYGVISEEVINDQLYHYSNIAVKRNSRFLFAT